MSLQSPKQTERIAASGHATNYNGIDLFKFLCALMIVIVHVPPLFPHAFGAAERFVFGLQHCLFRIAVPFYFVSSGFLLFGKMPLYEPNGEIIKTYCFKILRLLGIWTVLLCLGENFQLWYLGATVIAVILLGLCLRRRIKFGYLCVLACVLYAIGLLGDSYAGVLAPLGNIALLRYAAKGYLFLFKTTRNGFFMGFIFVLMGAAFSHRRINMKPWVSFVGLLVSMLCLLSEAFLLRHFHIPIDYNMYIFLVPAVFFLFSFALSIRLKDRPVYKHLRNIGTLMYFMHLMIYYFVAVALEFLGFEPGEYRFIGTLILTLLFAVCIDWLSGKKKFAWLKWLVS